MNPDGQTLNPGRQEPATMAGSAACVVGAPYGVAFAVASPFTSPKSKT